MIELATRGIAQDDARAKRLIDSKLGEWGKGEVTAIAGDGRSATCIFGKDDPTPGWMLLSVLPYVGDKVLLWRGAVDGLRFVVGIRERTLVLPYIDIRDFGVYPDLDADHTAGLLKAIAATPEGHTLYGIAGYYNVSDELHFTVPNVTLSMPKATLRCTAAGLQNWLTIEAAGVTFLGMTLDDNLLGRTIVQILEGADDFTARDVEVTGYSAEYGYFATDSAFRNNGTTGMRLIDCRAYSWGDQYAHDSGTLTRVVTLNVGCIDTEIVRMRITEASQGIVATDATDTLITDLTTSGVKDNPIYFGSPQGLRIDGAFLDDGDDEGVVLIETSGTPGRNIKIRGLTVKDHANKAIGIHGDFEDVDIEATFIGDATPIQGLISRLDSDSNVDTGFKRNFRVRIKALGDMGDAIVSFDNGVTLEDFLIEVIADVDTQAAGKRIVNLGTATNGRVIGTMRDVGANAPTAVRIVNSPATNVEVDVNTPLSHSLPVDGSVIVDGQMIVTAWATPLTLNAGSTRKPRTYRIQLDGDTTINAPTNPTGGQVIRLVLKQDGTGSRLVTWNSAFKFNGGTAPTLTTTAGKKDSLTFVYDSTDSVWLEQSRVLNLG